MISNGIDIVKIDRFDKIKHKSDFLNKYFCENEISYIESKNFNSDTIAGIFAAKEAFLKALKKGIDYCPLNDIEIAHNNGVPFIVFHNNSSVDINNMSLSISHDGNYAIAIVSIIL